MIGGVIDRVVSAVLEPQEDELIPEDVRIVVDVEAAPADAHPQTAQVVGSRSRPVMPSIGEGLLVVEHEVLVAVVVDFAKTKAETRRRRDAITLDLIVRYLGVTFDVGDEREVGRTWAVDYATLGAPDTLGEYATLTLTVQTEREV